MRPLSLCLDSLPALRESAGTQFDLSAASSLAELAGASALRLGVGGVELFTGATVDLPTAERRGRLDALGDAARLAAKLRMSVGVGGGLDYRSVSEVLEIIPSADFVSVGRAVLARSLLVGIDRAVRDFSALLR